jgi:hypothetical protein
MIYGQASGAHWANMVSQHQTEPVFDFEPRKNPKAI